MDPGRQLIAGSPKRVRLYDAAEDIWEGHPRRSEHR